MRVLLISPSNLGDAILCTGILRHLEETYPKLEVTVATGPLPAPIFKSIPFCKKVHILHKKSFSRHWVDLWKTVRHQKFDQVIDLRGSLLSFFLSTKKRFIWNQNIAPHAHQVERVSSFLKLKNTVAPKLWLDFQKCEQAKNELPESFLAVSPAANWMGKQWPLESFAKILKGFQQKFDASHVVLFASPKERETVEKIQNSLDLSKTHAVLTEDLSYVTAALSRASLFLGNDSGLMHMAAALDVPSIGLFGPSNEKRYGPYGTTHKIIRGSSLANITSRPSFSFKGNMCYMEDIEIDEVQKVLFDMWMDQKIAI